MSSRHAILDSLKEVSLDPVDPPDLSAMKTIHYDDPVSQFEKTLELVGGALIRVASRNQIFNALESLPVYCNADSFFSTLDEGVRGEEALSSAAPTNCVDLAAMRSPKDLNGLELAIVEGDFAVAENAAIWVKDSRLEQRAVLFLAEHLILVVSREDLINNMHEAYRRLSFAEPSFGLFISGPSKTADIEQSLVIGAQGPRSLHVLLIE